MVSPERPTSGSDHVCAIVNKSSTGHTSTDFHIFSPEFHKTQCWCNCMMFLLYVNGSGDKIASQTTIKPLADDVLLRRTINDPYNEIQLQNDTDTMIE